MYDVSSIGQEPLLLEPLSRSIRDGMLPLYLRSAKLEITARCNLRCVMCKYGRGLSPPELPGARFREIIDEMAQLGCRKVHFSGGEVLARDDFEDIAARAARAGMKVTLTSNLTLLTKDRAKHLMAHKINSISTSLDGPSPKLHDRVRGIRGSFKRTLRGMGLIARERERRGRRTRLRVNFVLMRSNFRKYPDLIRVAADNGATEVHPMPVDSKDPRLRLSKRLIRSYNEEVAPKVRQVRKTFGLSTDNAFIYPFGRSRLSIVEATEGRYAGGYYAERPCYAPFLHMFVAWDGKVYLCCMTNGRIEPLGDLARQSVAEVFLGERFQRMRQGMLVERLPACHACDMFLTENRTLHASLQEPSQPVAPSSM